MIKKCVICGAKFDAWGKQLACSDNCSKEYKRRKGARWRLSLSLDKRSRMKEYMKAYHANRTNLKVIKSCEICGGEFLANQSNYTTCSAECSREKRRLNSIERGRIHYRTLKKCVLCGLEFDVIGKTNTNTCGKQCSVKLSKITEKLKTATLRYKDYQRRYQRTRKYKQLAAKNKAERRCRKLIEAFAKLKTIEQERACHPFRQNPLRETPPTPTS